MLYEDRENDTAVTINLPEQYLIDLEEWARENGLSGRDEAIRKFLDLGVVAKLQLGLVSDRVPF